MTHEDELIACPRFGGFRRAPACIVLDRYRACRKSCRSLEDHIKARPERVDEAKDKLEASGKKLEPHTLFACKDLPDSELRCPYCEFQAKSLRGLKVHTKRTHKKTYA